MVAFGYSAFGRLFATLIRSKAALGVRRECQLASSMHRGLCAGNSEAVSCVRAKLSCVYAC